MTERDVVESGADMIGERSALRARIAESRRALDAVVAALTPASLAVGAGEQWSAGDHLWHLAAWEAALCGFLTGQSWDEALDIADGDIPDRNDFDAINRLVRERGRGLGPAEVRSAYHDAHCRLLALLDQLPDEAIFGPARAGQPRQPEYIGDNTYEHFDEHRAALAALVARRA